MVYVKFFLFITISSFTLFGCSSNRNVIANNSLSTIYASSKKKIQHSDFSSAIKELEIMNKLYPYCAYSQQIQLNLIYAYYKSGNFSSSKKLINDFLRLYPTSRNIDYVLYIRGLSNMESYNNLEKNFFDINKTNCDPAYARAAFYDFKKLISKYPTSQYAIDSSKRLIYLKNQLAQHMLSIVKYYSNHSADISVVNRVEKMLYDFPDTAATREALLYMKRSYQKLHLTDQAKVIEKIIIANSSQ